MICYYYSFRRSYKMKTYTVAVLGATGAVGQEMMKVLEERDFPVGKLIPLASARSAGKTLKFKGEDVEIKLACEDAFEGVDIVLGAAENDIAKQFAPAIVAAGAVFVDNSSAFRLDPKVPLIVPEVNPEDAAQHNIHTLECFVASQLDGHILALELQGLTCAALAGQGDQLTNGEVPLLQNLDHFLTHSAGGAENCNSI